MSLVIKIFTVCCADLQRAEQSALVTTALVLDMLTAGLYTDMAVRGTLSTSESSYCFFSVNKNQLTKAK